MTQFSDEAKHLETTIQFRITINCSGAAFENREAEIARILRDIAHKAEAFGLPDYAAPILDTNGNTCGSMVCDDDI